MCGLFGMAIKDDTGFSSGLYEVLLANMSINMFRGEDSTGIVNIDKLGRYAWMKSVGSPGELLANRAWGGFRKQILDDAKIVFGHGRAATRGKVNQKNAHPFLVPVNKEKDHYIVLAHNGTLTSYQQLDGMDKHDVDSEWLATMVAKHGAKEALGKVAGAIATIWYDNMERKTFFFRNDERPLHWVRTSQGTLLVNSEKAALMWLKYKFNLGFADTDVREFTPRVLYSISAANPEEWCEQETINRVYPTYVSPVRYPGSLYPTYGEEDDWQWKKPNIINYTPSPRGLQEDIEYIRDGSMRFVKFDSDGTRSTHRGDKHNGWTSLEKCAPYVDNLISIQIEDSEKRTVRVQYADHVDVILPPEKKEENLPDDNIAFPLYKCQRNGKKATCSIFQYNMENLHKFTFTSSVSKDLQYYWNTHDGRFHKGKRINVEIWHTDFETLPNGGFLVRPQPLQVGSKMYRFVDLIYYTKKLPLEMEGTFSGKIKSIEFTTREEWQESRSYIKIELCDLEEISLSEQTEEKQVVNSVWN